jgi:hypothetical protein
MVLFVSTLPEEATNVIPCYIGTAVGGTHRS